MIGLSSSLVGAQKREMNYGTVVISNVKTEKR